MIERYDSEVRDALVTAFELAKRSLHREIGPEHILLALINEGGGVAAEFVERNGLTADHARQVLYDLHVSVDSAVESPQLSAAAAAALATGRQRAAMQSRQAGAADLLAALIEHSPRIAAVRGQAGPRRDGQLEAPPPAGDSAQVTAEISNFQPVFDYLRSVAALEVVVRDLASLADGAELGRVAADSVTAALDAAYRELEIVQFGIRNVLHALPMAQDDWVEHARRRPEFAVMAPALKVVKELFRLNGMYNLDRVLTAAGHTFATYVQLSRELDPPAAPGSSADLSTLEPFAAWLPDWIRACIRARRMGTVLTGIDNLTSVTSFINPSWWEQPDDAVVQQVLREVLELNADASKQFWGRRHFERYHRNLGRKRVALARKHNREVAFLAAYASNSVPQLASDLTARDIVYLGASVAGDGVALRMNASTKESEGMLLPGFGRAEVAILKKIERDARASYSAKEMSYAEHSAAVWSLILDVGERVVEPLLRRWPDLRSATLVPIGHAYGLPYGVVPLIDDYRECGLDLTVCPSARTMLVSALSSRAPGNALRVFVGADCDVGRNVIPRASQEVDHVAMLWQVEPTVFNRPINPHRENGFREILTGLDSSDPCPSSVVDGIVGADVVHLSCHGRLGDDPPRAELKLGGILNTNQLMERGMRAGAVVVLSACSVGNINARYSTEVLGFPTVLLGAGARNVMASLWPVPDSQPTVDFMLGFHRLLLAGDSPTEAFRRNVAGMAESGESPAIWGGYNLFGV